MKPGQKLLHPLISLMSIGTEVLRMHMEIDIMQSHANVGLSIIITIQCNEDYTCIKTTYCTCGVVLGKLRTTMVLQGLQRHRDLFLVDYK